MRQGLLVGTIAAVGTGAVLAALDARDFSRDPATDTADVVATSAVVFGAVVWLALRFLDRSDSRVQLVRAVAAGIAIGALVTGLASVVYDPFAN